MKSKIFWLKTQMQNQKFRILLIAGILMEIALAIEFVMFSYSVLKIIRYLILIAVMIFIAWIDHCDRKIPNRILLFLLSIRGIVLVVEWLVFPDMGAALLISSLLGLSLGGILFLLAHFISRGGVGMGDVKLFAVIGAYVGGGNIMTVVFLTVMVSAVYSIIMLVRKKIKLKEEIPFAPFALAGTVMAMALGM